MEQRQLQGAAGGSSSPASFHLGSILLQLPHFARVLFSPASLLQSFVDAARANTRPEKVASLRPFGPTFVTNEDRTVAEALRRDSRIPLPQCPAASWAAAEFSAAARALRQRNHRRLRDQSALSRHPRKAHLRWAPRHSRRLQAEVYRTFRETSERASALELRPSAMPRMARGLFAQYAAKRW